MGIHRGSNIIKSGLEFAYDTGYSPTFTGDSSYIYNQGEPTVNLLDNSDDWSSNWTGNLFNNWINATVTPNAGVAPDGTTTASKLTGGYSRWQRISCSTNTTYTFSFWIKNIDLRIAPHIHIAFGLNGSLVNYNNITSIALNTIGEWTRVSKTHTSPSSGINQMELGVAWSANHPNTDSVLVWHAKCEQNSHMTPFAYKNNDRSATNSLLDITKKSSTDLTNVSFDSNAHMTFDGTNDYIDINTNFGTVSQYTFEWIENPGTTHKMPIANRTNTEFYKYGAYSWRYKHGGTLGEFYHTAGATSGWHHWAVTYDGTTLKVFQDNISLGTRAVTGTADFSDGFKVGWWSAGGAYAFNGEIPIMRIYSKALTTQAVAQNFNAYRGRFNI